MINKLNWDSVGRICIYLLFGLVPVFFLPLTAYPAAENKAMLAGVLVFVAFGAYLASALSAGKISFPKTKLWLALGAFLIISAVSTIASASPQISLFGNLGSSSGLVHFIVFGLAMFLTPLYLRDVKEIIRALLFFSISLFVISIYSLLQFFGIFIIPFEFAKNIAFNPVGTVQALAIFLGSGLVMMMALLTSFKLSSIPKAIFALSAALLAVVLILVNFSYVWLGILFASALVASWQIMHSRKSGNKQSAQSSSAVLAPKFGLPLVLMIIVAILFFVRPPISSVVRLPAEVRPSLSATLNIARASLGSEAKNAILGSGPSMFLYEYLENRSSTLNSTAFWGVRFSQGYAALPTFLITLGVLGVGALVFLFGFFLWLGFKGIAVLSRKKGEISSESGQAERVALVSFVSFLFLLLSWFFYPANFTILLFTFLFAGVVIASLRAGGALSNFEFSLLHTPQRTFAASLVIIVLIVSVIVSVYWQGQKYVAQVVHTVGVSSYNSNRDLDDALRKVALAVNLDDSRDVYLRTYTQLLGLQAQKVLDNRDLDSAELQRRYQVVFQGMIQTAQRATTANPADPLNWRQLAAVYEDNISIVEGADRFAILNYEKAAALNPQSPAEYLNVARAYVRSADALQRKITQLPEEGEEREKLEATRAENLSEAIVNLKKSIALKGDYAPAHFLSSQVYERQGDRELAIQKTLETRNLNPLDTGVGYQLGLLYYLDDQIENARDEFVRVVSLREGFSNARYFLGLSYDRLGNTQGAIDQFAKVSELNPDNEEVDKILSNLRAGEDALDGISPPSTPPTQRIEPPVAETGGEEPEALEEIEESEEE